MAGVVGCCESECMVLVGLCECKSLSSSGDGALMGAWECRGWCKTWGIGWLCSGS